MSEGVPTGLSPSLFAKWQRRRVVDVLFENIKELEKIEEYDALVENCNDDMWRSDEDVKMLYEYIDKYLEPGFIERPEPALQELLNRIYTQNTNGREPRTQFGDIKKDFLKGLVVFERDLQVYQKFYLYVKGICEAHGLLRTWGPLPDEMEIIDGIEFMDIHTTDLIEIRAKENDLKERIDEGRRNVYGKNAKHGLFAMALNLLKMKKIHNIYGAYFKYRTMKRLSQLDLQITMATLEFSSLCLAPDASTP